MVHPSLDWCVNQYTTDGVFLPDENRPPPLRMPKNERSKKGGNMIQHYPTIVSLQGGMIGHNQDKALKYPDAGKENPIEP
jgi:hypothetical protein